MSFGLSALLISAVYIYYLITEINMHSSHNCKP
jgi:hypothetical protein